MATISVGELEATIRLKDQLTAELRKVVGEFEKAGAAMKQVGENLRTFGTSMTTAISAPLGAAAGAAFKFGKDFESAMMKVHTLTDTSTESVKDMREQVLQLSKDVGKGPEELAHALLIVSSTGIKGQQAMDILTRSAKAAAVGLGDTGDIARAVTAAITAYGAKNIDAATATDQLFTAVVEGGAEAEEFAGSLGRVIGVSSQLKVSFAEVLASVATFTRVGVDADEAVTALRQTMMNFLHPSVQARKELVALGSSVQDMRDRIERDGLRQALIHLVELTKGNHDAIGAIIPNVRALAGILATAGSQAQAYESNFQKILAMNSKVEDSFAEVADTTAMKWNQLIAGAQVLAIELGEKLAPHFDSLIVNFSKMVDWLVMLADGFGKLPRPVQDVAVAVAALAIAIGPIAYIVGNLVYAFGALTTTVGLVQRAMLAFGNTVPVLTARLWLMDAASSALGMTLQGLCVVVAAVAAAFVGWKIGEKLAELNAFGLSLQGWVSVLWNWKLGLSAMSLEELKFAEASYERGKALTAANESAAESFKQLKDRLSGAFEKKSVEDITKAVRDLSAAGQLTPQVMKRVATEAAALQKAGAELTPELQNIVTWFERLNKPAAAGRSGVAQLTEEAKTLKEALGGNATQELADLAAAWNDLTAAQRANPKIVEKLISEYEDLRGLVAPNKLPKDIENLWRQFDYLANFEEDLSGHHEHLKDAQEAVTRSMQGGQGVLMRMAQATGTVRLHVRDLGLNVNQMGKEFRDANGNVVGVLPTLEGFRAELARLRQEFVDTHGKLALLFSEFKDGKVYEALEDVDTILNNINAEWAQMTSLVVRAAKAVIENLAEGDILGAIVAAAAAFADKIADVLHDAEYEKIGRDVGERLGVGITEGLAQQIEKDSNQFNRTAAILLNLDKIVDEAGGVKEFGITKAIDQLRSAFSFVESGQLTIQQLGEVIDENFSDIIPEAVSKGTGLVRRDMLEVIKLSREWGVESAELADFLSEQADRVAGGFNKIAAGAFGKAFEEFEKFKESLGEDDPLLKDAEALSRAFQDGFTLPTQESLDRLGRLAVTSFNTMIASGASLVDALAAVGPGLDTISRAMDEFGGFTAAGPISELLGLQQWVSDNMALAESISGVNDMLVGLHNSGMLNQATFTDLNLVVTDTFNAMIAQGLDGNQALLLLQPSLQTLWELQQDFGYAVDESTQALINQAIEQGIVGEEMRDVNERILGVLEAIARVLGADIPNAAQNAARNIPQNPFADWHVPEIRFPDVPDVNQMHSGGMVERLHGGLNFIRAHSGLMVDEVPAILQTGEAVLNRRATASLGSSTISELNGGRSFRGGGEHSENFNHMLAALEGIRADNIRNQRALPKQIRDAILLAS